MSEQVERLARLAGDNNSRAPKYVVPLIRFNGNTGEFRVVDMENDKAETPITKPVEIVVLKKRKALASFSPNGSYFTNEYNSPTQKVNLYKNIEGVVTHEATDAPPFLREKYQALRTKEILYVLYDGRVHKLEVKGGSLGDYYDYLTALSEEDLHTFQVVTSIDSEKAKNETGFSYFKMTFAKTDKEVDLDTVESNLNTVNEEVGKLDAYFAQKIAQDFRSGGGEQAAPVKSQADIEFDALGKSEEEVNVDDIPF